VAIRDNVREREFLILIHCVFVAFALRFYTFDKKSFWLDEIYTLRDSKDDLKGQIKFYKDNPTYLQAPLFFMITHQLILLLYYHFQKQNFKGFVNYLDNIHNGDNIFVRTKTDLPGILLFFGASARGRHYAIISIGATRKRNGIQDRLYGLELSGHDIYFRKLLSAGFFRRKPPVDRCR